MTALGQVLIATSVLARGSFTADVLSAIVLRPALALAEAACQASPGSPPPPSRRRSNPVRPPSGRSKGCVFLPPAASGCSDMAAATRLVWGLVTYPLTPNLT